MYRVINLVTTDKEAGSYEKRMSICLLPNGFSFSVITSSGVLLTWGEVSLLLSQPMSMLITDIKSFFIDHHIYPVDFKSMTLVSVTGVYTWVPDALFDESLQRRYLELAASIPANATVLSCHNNAVGAHLVYASDATVVTAFRVALPGIDCMGHPSVLISDEFQKRSVSHPLLLVYVTAKGDTVSSADFVAMDSGRLLLSTWRKTEGPQALLYTALAMMKQLEIERPDMELLLCGAVDRALFMQMRGYFPHLDLWKGRHYRTCNTSLAKLHTHRHLLAL